MKKVEVVAAIIQHDEKILCVQRGENKLAYISKKFEFPGGKIERGESRVDALKRELIEELEVREMDSIVPFLTVVHPYPDFELTMHSFEVKVPNTSVQLLEHIDQKWLRKEELLSLDWAAADIPIVHELMGNGK